MLLGGLRKCATGGAIGLVIASVYSLWVSRDRLDELRQRFSIT